MGLFSEVLLDDGSIIQFKTGYDGWNNWRLKISDKLQGESGERIVDDIYDGIDGHRDECCYYHVVVLNERIVHVQQSAGQEGGRAWREERRQLGQRFEIDTGIEPEWMYALSELRRKWIWRPWYWIIKTFFPKLHAERIRRIGEALAAPVIETMNRRSFTRQIF